MEEGVLSPVSAGFLSSGASGTNMTVLPSQCLCRLHSKGLQITFIHRFIYLEGYFFKVIGLSD